MTHTITIVPPTHVRSVWKKARALLQPAIDLSHGRWTPDYVLVALALGEHNLWVVVDDDGEMIGALTTQVVTYPELTMLAIHFLGGTSFDDWYSDMLATLSRYASDAGCAGLEAMARFGFWKWFKDDGWEKTSAFYEKML